MATTSGELIGRFHALLSLLATRFRTGAMRGALFLVLTCGAAQPSLAEPCWQPYAYPPEFLALYQATYELGQCFPSATAAQDIIIAVSNQYFSAHQYGYTYVRHALGSGDCAEPSRPTLGTVAYCHVGAIPTVGDPYYNPGLYVAAILEHDCPSGTRWVQRVGFCVQYKEIDQLTKTVTSAEFCVGHPIYPLLGIERESVATGMRVGQELLTLTYDSSRQAPEETTSRIPRVLVDPPALGTSWLSSLHRQLVVQPTLQGARAARGDGHVVSFAGDGAGHFSAEPDGLDRLVSVPGGYRYIDALHGAVERYDADGRLVELAYAAGQSVTLSYSDAGTPPEVAPAPGFLLKAQDSFGRSLNFTYVALSTFNTVLWSRVKTVTDASGGVLTLGYDSAGNLNHIRWPDGQVRQFRYENPSFEWALTGVIDENGARHATIGYDAQGRAVSTELGGGVARYAVTYETEPWVWPHDDLDLSVPVIWRYHSWRPPTGTRVTLPNGSSIGLDATAVHGYPRLGGQTQSAGSGCAASASSLAYDASGNVASRNDFNGTRACFVHDRARNLETARIEGMDGAADCDAVRAGNAPLPAGTRQVSTTWHPDWRLPVQRAEPGRITTYVYNGQPDPFNDNAPANCAPAAARLPDGQPIAVLCRQVEQATTDADGHLGFGAPLQPTVAPRVQSWTYNAQGQVLAAKGPRADVDDTTRYTYYATTTADHTTGDLATVTNALGQVTRYTRYNRNGQVLEMTDANGVPSVHTYDLRSRLTGTVVAGQSTSYDYGPTGLPRRVTFADASWIGYEYDDAHWLRAITDDLGNRIDYSLDNSGRRTEDKVKDPLGTLARKVTRSIDALGRVQLSTGRE